MRCVCLTAKTVTDRSKNDQLEKLDCQRPYALPISSPGHLQAGDLPFRQRTYSNETYTITITKMHTILV